MPNVKGTVDRIFVNPSICCLTIKRSDGSTKVMLLWSYLSQDDNATNRLLHGSYLGMARDALAHNKTIEVSHSSGSAFVNSVSLES